jgi:hypothetical protein
MNWEALGAIGEIVGAVAVIATLGYLALQIRQNTRNIQTNTQALRLAAYDSFVTTAADVRRSLFENEEVARIYETGLADPDQLQGLDQTRFRVLMLSAVQGFQIQYFQLAHSELFPEAWEAGCHTLRRVLNQPGGARYWASYKHEFPAGFAQEVDRVLSESASPRATAPNARGS